MDTNLHKFFGQIYDPRIDRKRKHLLIDIIILTVIAVISGADYILALKSNQKYLKEDVENIFKIHIIEHTAIEKGHGRIETRQCEVIDDLKFLDEQELKWKKLTSIVKLTSIREINNSKTEETRWHISSLDVIAEKMNTYIRKHWQIENSLHWTLNVTFREDYQRKRNKNAAQNFAIILKIALNPVKAYKTTKQA